MQSGSQTSATPIGQSVVLLGAGNAHLVFARMFGMDPLPGVAVTLVNQGTVIPYSAMVPAHLGGEFPADEITFDLVRVCAAFGIRLIAEPAAAVDPARREVRFADRPPVLYDILSLGLGSVPEAPPGVIDGETSFVMRPLSRLIARLDRLAEELRRAPRPVRFAVVGGGASGCELSLAIARRMAEFADFRITLLQGNERLLPRFPAAAAKAFGKALASRRIEVRTNARVIGGTPGQLQLESGEELSCDFVLWATQGGAPELIAASGLAVTESGFLRVRKTLQSVSEYDVFGTGDCVAFDDYPQLAKSGVYAVREGRVLFENVRRRARGETLRDFRPQQRCLYLLNTGDGDAVLNYGLFAWKAKWVRRLKNWIDQRWVRKFTEFPRMQPGGEDDESAMRCGGCGSKVPAEVLSSVLKSLPTADDERILLGLAAADDAAVSRLPQRETRPSVDDELVEVQTVDYFRSFLADPYLFGRIAALNAASDLYAMNATPSMALAIATLPYARTPIQAAQLNELLRGAVRSFEELGITLAGGHTTEGAELALGFSVTGYARQDKLFRKSGLQPGDALILTKPLGTGALLAALMRAECQAKWYEQLLAGMLQANASAAEIFSAGGVTACTDVTGFGLAGHLLEMLQASGVSARLDIESVPLYPGFNEVTAQGIRSSLFDDNARAGSHVHGPKPPAWLFDPQTSGGLLGGVAADEVQNVLECLRETGSGHAARIGTVENAGNSSSGPAIFLA